MENDYDSILAHDMTATQRNKLAKATGIMIEWSHERPKETEIWLVDETRKDTEDKLFKWLEDQKILFDYLTYF